MMVDISTVYQLPETFLQVLLLFKYQRPSTLKGRWFLVLNYRLIIIHIKIPSYHPLYDKVIVTTEVFAKFK